MGGKSFGNKYSHTVLKYHQHIKNYEKETVSLQWRDLAADTTITDNQTLPSPVMGRVDIMSNGKYTELFLRYNCQKCLTSV